MIRRTAGLALHISALEYSFIRAIGSWTLMLCDRHAQDLAAVRMAYSVDFI